MCGTLDYLPPEMILNQEYDYNVTFLKQKKTFSKFSLRWTIGHWAFFSTNFSSVSHHSSMKSQMKHVMPSERYDTQNCYWLVSYNLLKFDSCAINCQSTSRLVPEISLQRLLSIKLWFKIWFFLVAVLATKNADAIARVDQTSLDSHGVCTV